ncbi:hypothetical protein SDC9_125983 [bioreactor metagenome]|uniref:Uncharacterized protein n=1 Tax=bioreactor metagenome TaxID=1076179 RepID=A0A645CPZ4_9ZZZZ
MVTETPLPNPLNAAISEGVMAAKSKLGLITKIQPTKTIVKAHHSIGRTFSFMSHAEKSSVKNGAILARIVASAIII